MIRIEAATDGKDVSDATNTVLDKLWTASNVVFSSGTGESLNLSVDNLTAHITDTTAGQGLTVAEANGITLTDVDTVDGDVSVTATLGSITVLDVDANTVVLDSTAGTVVGSGSGTHIAAGAVDIDAETGIGSTAALHCKILRLSASATSTAS